MSEWVPSHLMSESTWLLNAIFQITHSTTAGKENRRMCCLTINILPRLCFTGTLQLGDSSELFNSFTKLLSKLVQAQRHQSQDVFCENVKTTGSLKI